MASSTTKPKFSEEIIELEKMAAAAPDDLFANIVLAGALQEGEFWEEAADYYRRARPWIPMAFTGKPSLRL